MRYYYFKESVKQGVYIYHTYSNKAEEDLGFLIKSENDLVEWDNFDKIIIRHKDKHTSYTTVKGFIRKIKSMDKVVSDRIAKKNKQLEEFYNNK